jgi:hypothetical protein
MTPAPPDRSSVLPLAENSRGRGRDPAAPTGHLVNSGTSNHFLDRDETGLGKPPLPMYPLGLGAHDSSRLSAKLSIRKKRSCLHPIDRASFEISNVSSGTQRAAYLTYT